MCDYNIFTCDFCGLGCKNLRRRCRPTMEEGRNVECGMDKLWCIGYSQPNEPYVCKSCGGENEEDVLVKSIDGKYRQRYENRTIYGTNKERTRHRVSTKSNLVLEEMIVWPNDHQKGGIYEQEEGKDFKK